MARLQQVTVCRARRRRFCATAAKALAEHDIPSVVSPKPLASGAYSLRVPTATAKQARRVLTTWMRLHLTPAERAKQLVYESWVSSDFRKHHAAQAILEAAVATNPTDTVLLTSLGAVLADRCRWAQAVGYLEKAIELGSTDRHAYLNLAIALMNCGDAGRARAERLFRKAHTLKPSPQTWEAYFDPHGH